MYRAPDRDGKLFKMHMKNRLKNDLVPEKQFFVIITLL